MIFKFDYFNRQEKPQVLLAYPNKDYIGELYVHDFTTDLCFTNISDGSFVVDKYKNKFKTNWYDEIANLMLIEIVNIGWFQITNIDKEGDGLNETKTVQLSSLENEATTKTLTSFGQLGVNTDEQGGLDRYKLYDILDTDHSIIHVWLDKMPSWTVGYIDPSITTQYRTFTNNDVGAYSFLVEDVSKTFECIFQFDTNEQTVSAYKLENIGELSSIYLSYGNVLLKTALKDNYSDIKTVFTVAGGDDNGSTMNIIEVNPSGNNQISNFSYYKSWMSQELRDALDSYEVEYSNRVNSFTPAITILQGLYAQRDELRSRLPSSLDSTNWSEYGLVALKEKYDIYNNNMSVYIGKTDATSQQNYQNNYVLREAVGSEIKVRELQITAKENQITAQKALCEGLTLNLEEYLGSKLYKELSRYYHEDTFTNDTFIATESMTSDEILEMKRELFDMATKELAKRCKPSYTLEVDAINFTAIPEFKEYADQLQLGNIMTIDFGDDILVESRLLKIHINWDNPDDFSLTFSSKDRLDGFDIQLAEIQSETNAVTTAYNYSGTGWNTAKNKTSTFSEYMSSTLDLAKQKLQASTNQEFYIDSTGTHWRRKNDTGDGYSHRQMWGVGNGLYLTQDSWNSVNMAVGEGTYNGQSVYGIWAPLICGDLLLGNKLMISNQSGDFTINDKGFTAKSGIYQVGINPSTPSTILNIKINGADVFYIDTVNQRMVYNGYINATGGTFSGTLSAGISITSPIINGGSITGTSFTQVGSTYTTTITNGTINTSLINMLAGSLQTQFSAGNIVLKSGTSVASLSNNGLILPDGFISVGGSISIGGYAALHVGNLVGLCTTNNLTVPWSTSSNYANSAISSTFTQQLTNGARYAYISSNDNLIGSYSSTMYVGSPVNPWAGGYGLSAWITTSDRNKKNSIEDLDDRYEVFFDNLVSKRFKMNNGTSNRYHVGWISNDVEVALVASGLTSLEFAGFVKDKIFSKMILDDFGNETEEYDTTSECIYNYFLRYEEFISLQAFKIQRVEKRYKDLLNRINDLEKILNNIN